MHDSARSSAALRVAHGAPRSAEHESFRQRAAHAGSIGDHTVLFPARRPPQPDRHEPELQPARGRRDPSQCRPTDVLAGTEVVLHHGDTTLGTGCDHRRRVDGCPQLPLCALGSSLDGASPTRTRLMWSTGDDVTERMVEANGVELCTEAFGPRPTRRSFSSWAWARRCCGGTTGSAGCSRDGGRFVIRYDHRDTGRSVTYQPGRPEYTRRRHGGRRRGRARRLRRRGGTRGRCFRRRGVRAAARIEVPRPRSVSRTHQHLSCDAG